MPKLTVHARRALVQERRQQILSAAARVFAEKGFDRATIRDVARAAGVAEGSIYNYFHSKQDLLVHIPALFIESPIAAFRAAASANTEPPPSPEALFTFIAESIVEIVTRNHEIMRVLFSTVPIMDDQTRAEYFREVPGLAIDALESYIVAQQAAGMLRADLDPAITARIFPGMMMFFLVVQEILQPSSLPRLEYDKVIPTLVQVFLKGVQAPQTGTSPS